MFLRVGFRISERRAIRALGYGRASMRYQQRSDPQHLLRSRLKGLYTLSLYNYNKDGESGMNRLRDYDISVRQHPADTPVADISGVESWLELAKARVHDFRGGAYTMFLVRGPQKLTIKVDRNYSYNAILAGVFLDEVSEEPAPYFPPQRDGTVQT
ncbi:MAG: hypothetical protein EOO38_18575, partial [Cytophagaceae bacterium]